MIQVFKEKVPFCFIIWMWWCQKSKKSYKQYYHPTVEIKYYYVVIDGRNFFDHPIKNDLKTYRNIRKIAAGEGDNYATGCFQQIEQIDTTNWFYWQSNKSRRYKNVFHYWREERSSFRFFKSNSKSIMILFCFDIILV